MMKTHFLLVFAFLVARDACGASLDGQLIGGGGVDDLHIVVRTATGKRLVAYCANRCGSWFDEDESTGIWKLKESFKGTGVTLEYSLEPNRSRIAGPGEREMLRFVTSLQLKPR